MHHCIDQSMHADAVLLVGARKICYRQKVERNTTNLWLLMLDVVEAVVKNQQKHSSRQSKSSWHQSKGFDSRLSKQKQLTPKRGFQQVNHYAVGRLVWIF
jgi:hypothetical protein